MTEMEKRNTELARKIIKALDRSDGKYFREVVLPDAEVRVMGNSCCNWMKTGADLIKANKSVGGDDGGWNFNFYNITAQDNRVSCEAESLHTMPDTGKLYNNEYHFFWQFNEEGKIVVWHEYSDIQLVTDVLFNGAQPDPATVLSDEERTKRFWERRKKWPQD